MFENFLYGEMPEASDLKNMILGMVIGAPDSDYDESSVGNVVRRLLHSYWDLLALENEDQFNKEQEAACRNLQEAEELFERVYRKAYAKGWESHRRNSGHANMVASVTYEEVEAPYVDLERFGVRNSPNRVEAPIPRWLIVMTASAEGHKDCRSAFNWTEWNIKAGTHGSKEYHELCKISGCENANAHVQEITELRTRVEVQHG